MHLSSGPKTLIASALVAAAILAGAAGVGYFQYAALAQRVDGEKLDAAGRAAQAQIQSRLERSRQLTGDIAGDPSVVSYIAQAMNTRGAGGQDVDSASIRDLIGNRARKGGFDFAAVLDDSGRVLTATDSALGGNAAVSRLRVAGTAMKRLAPAAAIGYLQDRVYCLRRRRWCQANRHRRCC